MELNKIVFLLPSIKTGGGNRMVIELSNELVNKGINVDIVYSNNTHDTNTFKMNKKIGLVPIGKPSNNKFIKIINLIKTYYYVNKNYYKNNIILTDPIMSILCNFIKHNFVYRFIQADDYVIYDDLLLLKSTILLKIYKSLTKFSYNYTHINYLFNSKYTYDQFCKISSLKDIEYKLIHPAISHESFYYDRLLNKNDINICLVARKHPWKGFKDFVDIFHSRKIVEYVKNIYIISHDDLSIFDLNGMIQITPEKDEDIRKYMNQSEIFISTSWWEGFGLPPLEAMACGCATIISRSGGVNEYAKDNFNCLMYSPKDKDELGDIIIKLIMDEKLRKKLSSNGINTAKDFSWKKSTDQLLSLLRIKGLEE